MIMESKAPHKVPAISTSEDSQEVQQPPSSSDYRSTATGSKSEIQHADKDESRDMGETHRVMHKRTTDRDGMNPSSEQKIMPCSVAVAGASLQMAAEKDNGCTAVGETGMNETEEKTRADTELYLPKEGMSVEPTVNESKNSMSETKEVAHHSLLPSPSASFDHAMDGQLWSHSFNHNDTGAAVSREKQTPKPKHRRSPATMVSNAACVSLRVLLFTGDSLLFFSCRSFLFQAQSLITSPSMETMKLPSTSLISRLIP